MGPDEGNGPPIPVIDMSGGALVDVPGGFNRRAGFGGRLALDGPVMPPEGGPRGAGGVGVAGSREGLSRFRVAQNSSHLATTWEIFPSSWLKNPRPLLYERNKNKERNEDSKKSKGCYTRATAAASLSEYTNLITQPGPGQR